MSDPVLVSPALIGTADPRAFESTGSPSRPFPPSACEEGAPPQAEYPILPNGQNVSAFGSLYSYESATPIEDALDFYKSELGAEGWLLEQEINAGNTAVLLFTMDDRDLSIAITENPNTPGILTIVIGEEG